MRRAWAWVCVVATSVFIGTAARDLVAQDTEDSISAEQPFAETLEHSALVKPPADLWAAAKSDDAEAINRFLFEGADLNAPDRELGVTPLSWAAALGHTDAMKLLLEKGADVNCRNRDGATALHTAAFFGQPGAARVLIEKGADVNAKTTAGHTPLDALKADWEITQGIAKYLRVEVDREKVEGGRKETARILRPHGAEESGDGLAILFAIIAAVVAIGLAVGVVIAIVTCILLTSALKALPNEHRQVESWQVWIMTFGLMGLFRKFLVRENKTMRYLSDSSYWLYLAHMPLIFVAQAVVRSWPLTALVKFILVCGFVTGFLLFTYQIFVRYTWLGTLLNGRRKSPTSKDEEIVAAELVGG
jgi:hypothetical protein